MHYFKRNIGDYHKKAGRLTMLQHGAYTLLIDACYDREKFPSLEDAIDWCWACSKDEIEAVEFVLKKFFTLNDGVYEQSRIMDEIDQYHKNAKTNKRIAIERETKRKENNTKRAPNVNEPPPNHKPLTKNHKPVTKNKEPKKNIKDNLLDDLPEGISKDQAQEYIDYRKQIKKPIANKKAFDSLMKKMLGASSMGYTVDEAMVYAMEKSWQGFEVSWLDQKVVSTQSGALPSFLNDEPENTENIDFIEGSLM